MDRTQTDDPGPRTANVHGWQPMEEGQAAPDAAIYIRGAIPDQGSDYRITLPAIFETEAEAIYTVLSSSLPGGTLHRLLIRMLQGKENLLVVREVPPTTMTAGAPTERLRRKTDFLAALYNTLRAFQEGEIKTDSTAVGALTQELTAVYDGINKAVEALNA